jgi:U3 small nucleolar RNA-associated protein 24
MGKAKKTKKFAAVKRMISPNDSRVNKDIQKKSEEAKEKKKKGPKLRDAPQVSSALFFKYNMAMVPPYQVLLDANFINLSIQLKLDVFKSLMDCLLAKCVPCVTDCVMAELEKLGSKYRLALRLAKDPRFKRLTCLHKGTYGDDCLCERVTQHKCYMVATNDKDLKRRIRKIPGVPIVYAKRGKYEVERVPDQVTNTKLA